MSETPTFELDLDKTLEFVIDHPTYPLKVTIRPIPKLEEVEIDKELRGGERVKISSTKKNGFRQKKGGDVTETMEIPDINQVLKNKMIAERSWVAWNIKGQPCNKENISKLFEFNYDAIALPIVEAYEERMAIIRGEEEDAAKN